MTVYNFHEIEQEPDGRRLTYVLVRAISAIHEAKYIPKIDPRHVEIALTVNGQPIDFLALFDTYEQTLDQYIEARARILARDKYYNLMDELDALRDYVHEVVEGLRDD